MFTFSKTKYFFSKEENEKILKHIRENEKNTSGEIRIFVENKCAYMDPCVRAQEIFLQYRMQHTINRNAVLIYIAYGDKDFAICGDKSIYEKTSQSFWNQICKQLVRDFHYNNKVNGLLQCIEKIGTELRNHFPYHGENKNELPDEIIFGK